MRTGTHKSRKQRKVDRHLKRAGQTAQPGRKRPRRRKTEIRTQPLKATSAHSRLQASPLPETPRPMGDLDHGQAGLRAATQDVIGRLADLSAKLVAAGRLLSGETHVRRRLKLLVGVAMLAREVESAIRAMNKGARWI